MTNTELAAKIIARVEVIAEERAEANDMDLRYGDWQDAEAGRRLSALLRRAHAYAGTSTDPNRPNLVICSVAGPDAHVWGYAASEILDSASQELPADVLDRPTGDVASRPYAPSATEVLIEELGTGVFGLFW